MRQSHATHPSPQALAAFAQGRLSQHDADTVLQHLAVCATCRGTVDGPPRETLLGFQPATQPGASLPAAPEAALDGVPAELARHPRYRVLRLLGQGGMGSVYLAEHQLMDRQVAVKVISRRIVDNADAIGRFVQEIKAAAKLNHPNIVAAYDAEQAGELHLFVMEFVEGHSLEEVVQKRGPLSVTAACQCVRQAALGLQHAHELGLVHRDLKPQNLMVTAKGVVKVLDFGLAKLARERQGGGGLTQENALMGTPDFIAPEQATDAQKADIRADIYSLGGTLYYLLSGRPPFPDGTAVQKVLAHLDKQPTPLRALRPEVPAELEAVVARMMAKDPDQRYQTPADVAQALASFANPGKAAAGKVAPVAQAVAPAPADPVWTALAASPPPAPARKDTSARAAGAAASGRSWNLWGLTAAILLVAGAGIVLGLFFFRTPEGTVIVDVTPADAVVTINGQRLDPTEGGPRTITLPAGQPHRLHARHPDHVEAKREFTLKSGQTENVRVELVRKVGVLIVEVTPADAEILLDHKPLAALSAAAGAPVRVEVPAGPHQLTLRKAGYRDTIRKFSLTPGATESVKAVLTPTTGTLVLEITPPDAEVQVGSRWVGGRSSVELPEDRYTLKIARDGWESQTLDIRIRGGQPERVILALKEIRKSNVSPEPPRPKPVETITELHLLRGHEQRVASVAFSPSGKQLLSASNGSRVSKGALLTSKGNTVKLWNVETGKELHSYPAAEPLASYGFGTLAISPNGNHILACREYPRAGKVARVVELLDAEGLAAKPVFRPAGFLGAAGLGFAPDNSRAYAASVDAGIWFLDLATGKGILPTPGNPQRYVITAAAFSANGGKVVLGHGNQVLFVDMNNPQLPFPWRGHADSVLCVAITSDGRRVLSGGRDGAVRLWEPRFQFGVPETKPLIGHSDAVYGVALAPNGRRALSASADGTLRLWDLATGNQLSVFNGHKGAVRCVAFAPDGKHAASGGDDMTIRVLRLPD